MNIDKFSKILANRCYGNRVEIKNRRNPESSPSHIGGEKEKETETCDDFYLHG